VACEEGEETMIVQIPTIYNIDHLRDIMADDLKIYDKTEEITPKLEHSVGNYCYAAARWTKMKEKE